MTENTKFGDYTLDAIVRELVPLWQALKTSREVLGSDMPAAKAAKEIEKKVHDGIKLAFDKKSKHWPGAETRTSKVAGQCAKL